MTLEEFKASVLNIIEEYSEDAEQMTDDNDIGSKINYAINNIINEVARFRKINARTTMTVAKDQTISLKDIDSKLYQLLIIRGVSYSLLGDTVIFNEDGTANIFYYKYPEQITEDTDDSYVFELSNDALEVAILGVAGLVLSSDVSNQYGAVYTSMYKDKLSTLDPRSVMPTVTIEDSIEI